MWDETKRNDANGHEHAHDHTRLGVFWCPRVPGLRAGFSNGGENDDDDEDEDEDEDGEEGLMLGALLRDG